MKSVSISTWLVIMGVVVAVGCGSVAVLLAVDVYGEEGAFDGESDEGSSDNENDNSNNNDDGTNDHDNGGKDSEQNDDEEIIYRIDDQYYPGSETQESKEYIKNQQPEEDPVPVTLLPNENSTPIVPDNGLKGVASHPEDFIKKAPTAVETSPFCEAPSSVWRYCIYFGDPPARPIPPDLEKGERNN